MIMIYSKKENAIYSKKIYSKKENAILDACINDKGDIFKEVRKMRYWTY